MARFHKGFYRGSEVSQGFIEVSPRFHPDFAEVSSRFHRGFIQVSRGFARLHEVSRAAAEVCFRNNKRVETYER